MRYSRCMHLATGAAAIVHELRVRDIRDVLAGHLDIPAPPVDSTDFEAIGRVWDWLVAAGLVSGVTGDEISMPDADRVIGSWLNLHGDLFMQHAEDARGVLAMATALDQFEEKCLILIERGHTGVADYGWAFFNAAIRHAKRRATKAGSEVA